MRLTLRPLPGNYTVWQLPEDAPVPRAVFEADGLVSVTRAPGELSIVCQAGVAVEPGCPHEGGWSALRVDGPLDFALTGVLASLAGALADAGISVFAISTYDTDVLLVKSRDL